MKTDHIIPKWVSKVLLLQFAAKRYPYIRGQIERLRKEEQEKAEKEAVKGRKIS